MPSPIGVRFLSFFIFSDRVSMFPLCYRRRQFPPEAIMGRHCLICNIYHFGDDCAMFLNFSLLEAVCHFCFNLNVRRSNHTVMLRSQNNYITSVLILCILASVCQSNSLFVVCTNTNYVAGRLCGDISISFRTHGRCPMGQDGDVHDVRHGFVPLLLTSSNKISCF